MFYGINSRENGKRPIREQRKRLNKSRDQFYGLDSPKYGLRQNNRVYNRMSYPVPNNLEVQISKKKKNNPPSSREKMYHSLPKSAYFYKEKR